MSRIERDGEQLLLMLGIGAIALWMLPKIIGNVTSGVANAITDMANNTGVTIGDAAYNLLNPTNPTDSVLPHTAQEAQLMIVNDPTSFAISSVASAVTNLESAGIHLDDARMGNIASFIINNKQAFTNNQVIDAQRVWGINP